MKFTARDFDDSFEEIEDIITLNGYTCVHTRSMSKNDNRVLCSSSLKEWLTILPSDHFVQVDRSAIINFRYATLSGHVFKLQNGRTLRIAERRYSYVKKIYIRYQMTNIMSGQSTSV